jgi:hypothetical protein
VGEWPAELEGEIRHACTEPGCDRAPAWTCVRCNRPLCRFHQPEDNTMCAPCNAAFTAELVRADRGPKLIRIAIALALCGAAIAAGGRWGLRILKWSVIVLLPVLAAIVGARYRRKRQDFIDRG